jgi:molybdopterin-guanine dinucleotide biosynthesis protein B
VRAIGLAGWSGSGKTQLIARLIPVLVARGLTVSTIKHAHASFDIDRPGKDSYVHRAAGAHEVLVSSVARFALIRELRSAPELALPELLAQLAPVDLVLIEGYKQGAHVKLEVHRAANGKPLLFPDDPAIRALVTDLPAGASPLPQVGLDDVAGVADLVVALAEPVSGGRAARSPS